MSTLGMKLLPDPALGLERTLKSAKHVVVLCHGLHKDVHQDHMKEMANRLGQFGIGTLRFDQYENGRSGGKPKVRSFDDWVRRIHDLTEDLRKEDRDVSILGYSMGGSAALVAASENETLVRCVAWVPGLVTREPHDSQQPYFEEDGLSVAWDFWDEYEKSKVTERIGKINLPTLVLLATADQFQSCKERKKAREIATKSVKVKTLRGYAHAEWTAKQAKHVIKVSARFLAGA
jgi:alpha-beta hydrolase superfamily lysophospholipase